MTAISTITAPVSRSGWFITLCWAAYLACSWTWCIGMFLPVLLVRDYGVWGFITFAVPNVVGAAAMGWVLRSPESSRVLVERHRPMMELFSIVTVVFQLFFLASLVQPTIIRPFAPVPVYGPILGGLALIILAIITRRRGFGLVAWIVSIALLCWAATTGVLKFPEFHAVPPSTNALALAPICAFGFLLCPYLDLTFHRARQGLPGASSKIAFTLGFGGLFFAMTLATLAYAATAIYSMNIGQPLGDLGPTLLAAHIVLQLLFTCAVHLQEVFARRPQRLPRGHYIVLIVLVIGSAVGLALDRPDARYADLSFWEITYRLFMSFYGLIFPAYVWLCMVPVRVRSPDGAGQITVSPITACPRRALITLGIATLLAAPLYWMGFIEREPIWLLPALAIILVARLAVRPNAKSLTPVL